MFFCFVSLCLVGHFHGGHRTVQNRADEYLCNLNQIETPEDRNSAILECLKEINVLLDRTATRKNVTDELAIGLGAVVKSLEMRNKDLKTQFEQLAERITQLDNETREFIDAVDSEIEQLISDVKTYTLSSLSSLVEEILTKGEGRAEKVESSIAGVIQEDKYSWLKRLAVLFLGVQILVVIFFVFYRALDNVY